MNPTPYPFDDFLRAKRNLFDAMVQPDDPFVLLTGDTGVGKTALLRQIRRELDRTRFRVLYFPEARKLGAPGLIKVIGENLRVPPSMCHSLSFERLLRTLAQEPQSLLLWLDEAHQLPEETLCEARALAEADLDGEHRVQVLLVGLPTLRAQLQIQTSLWRRIVVREEITGLVFDELQPFLAHHFADKPTQWLCDQGQAALFERANGRPGLLLPMVRALFAKAKVDDGPLKPARVDEILDAWDLA